MIAVIIETKGSQSTKVRERLNSLTGMYSAKHRGAVCS